MARGGDIPVTVTVKDSEKAKEKLTALSAAITGVNQAVQLAGQAWGALGGFIESSIGAAMEASRFERDLRAALSSIGEGADDAAESSLRYAQALQDQIGVEGDSIVQLHAHLARLQVLPQNFEAATIAAIGWSRTMGVDLVSAGETASKVIAGNIEQIRKINPQIKTSADALAFMSRGFSGVVAEAGTFEGELRKLENAWGDFGETIGGLVTGNESATKFLSNITAGINHIAEAVKVLSPALEFLGEQFEMITDFWADFARTAGNENTASGLSDAMRKLGDMAGIEPAPGASRAPPPPRPPPKQVDAKTFGPPRPPRFGPGKPERSGDSVDLSFAAESILEQGRLEIEAELWRSEQKKAIEEKYQEDLRSLREQEESALSARHQRETAERIAANEAIYQADVAMFDARRELAFGFAQDSVGILVSSMFTGFDNIEQAFSQMLERMAQEMLASTILSLISTALGGGGIGILGGLFGGAVGGFAHGGMVDGPAGTDRVPAMLTAGEYVLPRSLVDDIRMGRKPSRPGHYADGGAVTAGLPGPTINVVINSAVPPTSAQARRMVRDGVLPALRDLYRRGL